MFDYMAASGQYVAILVLCISCWAAGRTARKAALLEQSNLALAKAAMNAPHGALATAADDWPDAQQAQFTAGRAAELHRLIRNADLSQEGVMESLVAMAEEVTAGEARSRKAGWSSVTTPLIEQISCQSPRILTRKTPSYEPLPADCPDPLTPEVLARYRLYAEECGSREGAL